MMYKYQGREITIREGAQLAGVNVETLANRLDRNGGDMEMAIAGPCRPIKLPDTEPVVLNTAEKQILQAIMGSPEPSDGSMRKMPGSIHALNELIDALTLIDRIEFDTEALRGELMEKRDELTAMRARMYGHMVDWGRVADEAAKQNS